MQFRVPQFIDIEDKVLGPLTWKQAAYSLGAVGAAYIGMRLSGSKILGLLISSPFIALFLSMAFIKINNRSFVDVLESALKYYSKVNLYTWKRSQPESVIAPVKRVAVEDNNKKEKTWDRESLKSLALDLDIKVDNK